MSRRDGRSSRTSSAGYSGPAITPDRRAHGVPLAGRKSAFRLSAWAASPRRDDGIEFIIAGAAAVQVGTANFADPLIWQKLIDGVRPVRRAPWNQRHRRSRRDHRHTRARKRMDQLIVALNVDNAVQATELALRLKDRVGGIKIGSTLFTAEGPALVRRLVEQGHRVFLDLKLRPTSPPIRWSGAVAAATKLGAWMLTVHASGGSEMLKAARRAAIEAAAAANRPAPLIVAVTALTSLDDERPAATSASTDRWSGRSRRSARPSPHALDSTASSPLRGRSRRSGRNSPRSRLSRPAFVPRLRRPMGSRASLWREGGNRRRRQLSRGWAPQRRRRRSPLSAARGISAIVRLTIYSKPGCHTLRCDEIARSAASCPRAPPNPRPPSRRNRYHWRPRAGSIGMAWRFPCC